MNSKEMAQAFIEEQFSKEAKKWLVDTPTALAVGVSK